MEAVAAKKPAGETVSSENDKDNKPKLPGIIGTAANKLSNLFGPKYDDNNLKDDDNKPKAAGTAGFVGSAANKLSNLFGSNKSKDDDNKSKDDDNKPKNDDNKSKPAKLMG
jgi:hypothetical protein